MNGMKSKQQGMGVLGWLAGLLVVGFLLSLSLKVMPIYLDDHALTKVIDSLDERLDDDVATLNQTRILINKGLQTNLVKMQPGELRVFKENGQVVVDIDYERRLKLLYNIDLILTFKHDWKAKNR